MNNPLWFRRAIGEVSFCTLPDAINAIRRELNPIQAFIALAFGESAGDLEVLQAGVKAMKRGEPVICKNCKKNLVRETHSPACETYKRCVAILNSKTPARKQELEQLTDDLRRQLRAVEGELARINSER